MKEELTYKIRQWWGSDAPYLSDQTFMERDQEAIKLLPVLVERGYHPELYFAEGSEGFRAWYFQINPGERYSVSESSIAEAITSAIAQLIEREQSNGNNRDI